MAIFPCDYYVRPANGSDANDGLTFATAWKSLQKALDTVTAIAGQVKTVGLVAEADEVITARIDDDTNMILAGAYVNFLTLNADGSYETNPTLRPTYWITADGLAITNLDMFRCAIAGNNNKYFENIGFKNCLQDAIVVNGGAYGMYFGMAFGKNIGRYGVSAQMTGTNVGFDFLHVDGCVSGVVGSTTGIVFVKKCFVKNSSGIACNGLATFSYGEIFISNCANGVRFSAKLAISRIYADSIAGYVYSQAGSSISNTIDRIRAVNCGSVLKAEAAANMITCRMLYKYNVTNNVDPASLGTINIINQVTMASSGKAGIAGDGNLTLLESAEYRRIAIPLDANNTYYQETGLSGPDYMRPRITGISDPTADVAGGTVRTLYVKGATGASAVTVDGTAATSFTVLDDNSISVTFPAKTAGTYAIAVTVGGVTWTSDVGLVKYIALPSSPGAFTMDAKVWGSGKAKVSWNLSVGATSYSIKRNGTTIVTGITGYNYYINTGLTSNTYEYQVIAVNDTGSTNSTNTASVVINLSNSELLLWDAFITVLSAYTDISSNYNVVFNPVEDVSEEADFPALVCYPVSSSDGTDVSISVVMKPKIWGTDDTASEDLLELVELIRLFIPTIPVEETWVTASMLKQPKLFQMDDNIFEGYLEVTIAQV